MNKKLKLSLIIPSFAGLAVMLHLWTNEPKNEPKPCDHFSLRGTYFYSIPVTPLEARIPSIDLEIEGICFQGNLDLGFNGLLSLPEEVLERIPNKLPAGSQISYGIRGKQYRNLMYKIPKMKIGELTFCDFSADLINPEFEHDLIVRSSKTEHSPFLARVGWKPFSKTNVLLDFSKSIIAFCDSLETLQGEGYPTDQFVKTDLILNHGFIEFNAITNSGCHRFVLDTGSTFNLIHKEPDNLSSFLIDPESETPSFFSIDFTQHPESDLFEIAGNNLGPFTFREAELPRTIDAIAGMEFLESQVVFIDFLNEKIYFYPQPEVQQTLSPLESVTPHQQTL